MPDPTRGRPADAPRRLGEILAAGTSFLERQGVEDARVACELLVAERLACPRLELYLRYDLTLDEGLVQALRSDVVRVGKGEPVQYVLGSCEFRGHRLKVDARALIPRPETEQLVQLLLDVTELKALAQPEITDVGTGSGCVVISLALERPNGRYTAVDASAVALSLARENACALAVDGRIRFVQATGCSGMAAGVCDALIANLPYIPSATLTTLPRNVRDHEPHLALDGGPDGLAVVRDVLRDAAIVLRPGGWIFLELGEDQPRVAIALLEDLGFGDRRVSDDLAGVPRFVTARFTG